MGEAERTLYHLEADSANTPLVCLPGINAFIIQPIALIGHFSDTITATSIFNSISREFSSRMEEKYF